MLDILHRVGLHLMTRDFAFVMAEVFCVVTIIVDARALATQKGRTILTMWPHLIRNSIGGYVLMWLLLSFTQFQEQQR